MNQSIEAPQVGANHPYLDRKGIALADLQAVCQASVTIKSGKVACDDAEDWRGEMVFRELVDAAGVSTGFERILPERITKSDGAKPNDKFMSSGGKVSGTFTPIGFAPADLLSLTGKLVVCAGLADGYSIHMATGWPVACCVGENNIASVVKVFRTVAGRAELLAAVDNDEAGRRAGNAAGVRWTCPATFKDWSDVRQQEGLGPIREQLLQVREPQASVILDRLERAKAKHLLASEPPPQRYVVSGMLPEPIAAAIVAPGQTGKSFWMMQLAACVASGVPFMGQVIPQPGSVLMLGAEDDGDELSRRLHAIAREYEWDGCRLDPAILGERFYAFPLVGQDNRLVKDGERIEGKIQEIIDTARAIPDLRLIMLDPVSRFRAGEENSNDDNTRFAEVLESIRDQTGVTVLVAHHSRKGSNGDSVDDMRGGSAFSDAVRFVATLSSPNEERAKLLGMAWEDARNMVRYRVVKSNYRVDLHEHWMRRGMGGVLKPTEAPDAMPSKAEAKGEERYLATLPKLRTLVRERDEAGEPLTRGALRKYAGQAGMFGVGDQSLRGITERAIEEGEIYIREHGTLHLY